MNEDVADAVITNIFDTYGWIVHRKWPCKAGSIALKGIRPRIYSSHKVRKSIYFYFYYKNINIIVADHDIKTWFNVKYGSKL